MQSNFSNGKRSAFSMGSQETKLTAVGFIVGMLIGLCIGGIGIAARGSAFSIPTWLVLGIALAVIGNRVGVGLDRPRA